MLFSHLRLSVVPYQKTKPQIHTDARRYWFLSSVSIDGQVTIGISARSTYIDDGTCAACGGVVVLLSDPPKSMQQIS
jgi:hypothetical protein